MDLGIIAAYAAAFLLLVAMVVVFVCCVRNRCKNQPQIRCMKQPSPTNPDVCSIQTASNKDMQELRYTAMYIHTGEQSNTPNGLNNIGTAPNDSNVAKSQNTEIDRVTIHTNTFDYDNYFEFCQFSPSTDEGGTCNSNTIAKGEQTLKSKHNEQDINNDKKTCRTCVPSTDNRNKLQTTDKHLDSGITENGEHVSLNNTENHYENIELTDRKQLPHDVDILGTTPAIAWRDAEPVALRNTDYKLTVVYTELTGQADLAYETVGRPKNESNEEKTSLYALGRVQSPEYNNYHTGVSRETDTNGGDNDDTHYAYVDISGEDRKRENYEKEETQKDIYVNVLPHRDMGGYTVPDISSASEPNSEKSSEHIRRAEQTEDIEQCDMDTATGAGANSGPFPLKSVIDIYANNTVEHKSSVEKISKQLLMQVTSELQKKLNVRKQKEVEYHEWNE